MDFTQAETDSIDSAKKAVAEMLTVSSRVEMRAIQMQFIVCGLYGQLGYSS